MLLRAYDDGLLGQTVMPEDSNPGFTQDQREERLVYFTLPMALNYQRDSYVLWKSALKTWNDKDTKEVFDISTVSRMSDEVLRERLQEHKLALQPNKHTTTWKTIAKTVFNEWGSFSNFINEVGKDFLLLQNTVQNKYKKGFPYLSGPKIFNYWAFILEDFGKVDMENREYISIAPDTHITQCSVVLGLITEREASSMSKDEIAEKWRLALEGSGITPIDMHPPLWFWSRNGFLYKL